MMPVMLLDSQSSSCTQERKKERKKERKRESKPKKQMMLEAENHLALLRQRASDLVMANTSRAPIDMAWLTEMHTGLLESS